MVKVMSRNNRQHSMQQQMYPLLVDGDAEEADGSCRIAEDEVPLTGHGCKSEMTSDAVKGSPIKGASVGGSAGCEGGTAGEPHPHPLGKRSSTVSLRNTWKLKYQDFLPVKHTTGAWDKSDSFQKLVDRANDWLKKNCDVQVKTCETLTWMSHEQKWLQQSDSEQMVLSKSIAEGSHTYLLRGLRLWLVPGSGSNQHRSIAYHDVVPDGQDSILDLVARANKKIEHKHLKGRILTIETVSVPMLKSGHLHSNITRWSEPVDHDIRSAFVLRIFTNKETNVKSLSPDKCVIGIKDVVPQSTEYGFEGFEVLIDRTNSWLKDQTDIIITNMQSVLVQKDQGSHSDMGSECFYTMPGINNMQSVEFFRILRVAYIRPVGDILADPPVVYPFTYETFTPELVRQKETGGSQRERLEKMKETFSKVIAFLRNSGADVICSETVMNPMQMFIVDDSDSLSTNHDEEMRFLFTIRIFLTGQISQLVDGSCSHPIKRAASLQAGPETADLLTSSEKPGAANTRAPLFLRHVVGRQFKYRWLMLAVSAFTCMTIIVVVSVVYSNR